MLQKPAGSLIYLATQTWRPATRADDLVRDLSRTLWRLANPDTPTASATTASDPGPALSRTDTPSSTRSTPRPHR